MTRYRPCRSRSSWPLPATRSRMDSSKTATASRPASLAWYMAVSASLHQDLSGRVTVLAGMRKQARCWRRRRRSCRGSRTALPGSCAGGLPDRSRTRNADDLAEHDHELVSTDARHEVGWPDVGAQPASHLHEEFAPWLCPSVSLIKFEPVKVPDRAGRRAYRPRTVSQQAGEVLLHDAPIGRAR